MDSTHLTSLIAASPVLTEQDRAYWTEKVTSLTEPQARKLEQILTKAQDIPWDRNVQTFLSLLDRATNAFNTYSSPQSV